MLDNNPDNVEDNFEKKFEENSEENKNNSINEAVDSLIESPDELQEIKDTTQLIDSEVSLTIKNTEFSESIEEIEVKAAVEAEDVKIVVKEIKDIDYSKMNLENLVSELEKVINEQPVNKVKKQVDGIKNIFNQQFGVLLAEKKADFISAGGESLDFQFSSPLKTKYNLLLSKHKKERDAFYNDQEKAQRVNLDKRFEVIENLKNLIINADTKTMYKHFKELQDSWRAIGPVSKTKYNDTWKIYHHHVERFYDLLHLSNDFRDLDFKNNLEEKLKIILKAESLAENENINDSFKELQELHKIWKEDIGPVAREMREKIWKKFSQATKKIHDKRHDYYRSMKTKFDEMIHNKLQIISQINDLDTSKNNNHSDWQSSINEIEKLRQAYFNEGKLPYAKSEEIWQKFKIATKSFNKAKNNFYKGEKDSQQDNLNKKIALIELAESLKNSTDWESSTDIMKKIQSDWKKIGHVPRKFSDDVWKRFKDACNYYFDEFHKNKNAVSSEDQLIIDGKKAFLEKIKKEEYNTKEALLEAINLWKDLGSLPRSVRHLEGKFNKQIDRLISSLSIDKHEIEILRFKNKVDSFASNNDVRKLDSEQIFIRKKVDEFIRETQQLENNLGFFSNAKPDNPLVLNVKLRLDEFKQDLSLWKEKLNYIKKLNY